LSRRLNEGADGAKEKESNQMPNFSELLSQKGGEAKPPKLLPPGNYPGIVSKLPSISDKVTKQGSNIIEVAVKPTGWPDDADEGERDGIDLSTKTFVRAFFVTKGDPDSFYRLEQFCVSCGVKVVGRTYDEILSELVGKDVVFQVKKESYEDREGNSREKNEIGNLMGA
jgi:hypothetical protein